MTHNTINIGEFAERATYQRKGFGEPSIYETMRGNETVTACKSTYPRICSEQTARDLLGCDGEDVERLCRAGNLRAVKLFGCWLIGRDSLFSLAHELGLY